LHRLEIRRPAQATDADGDPKVALLQQFHGFIGSKSWFYWILYPIKVGFMDLLGLKSNRVISNPMSSPWFMVCHHVPFFTSQFWENVGKAILKAPF